MVIKMFEKYRDKEGNEIVPYLFDGFYYVCKFKATTTKFLKEDIFPYDQKNEEVVEPDFIN